MLLFLCPQTLFLQELVLPNNFWDKYQLYPLWHNGKEIELEFEVMNTQISVVRSWSKDAVVRPWGNAIFLRLTLIKPLL